MFKKFLSLSLALLAVFVLVTPVMASPTFLSSDSGFINITNVINDDVYIGGGQIIIEEDINGDLFIGGGDVDLKGNVSGDVLIAAGTVLIRGNIGDDLRIVAGDITIEGTIGDDVFAGTGLLTISDTAVIKGDLISGSGDFKLYGKVLGNVKSEFEQGEFTGTINGYANLRYKGSLSVGSDAQVLGKLTYTALSENPDLADIAGSIEYRKMSSVITNKAIPFLSGTALAWLIPSLAFGGLLFKYLSILLLGGLIIWFVPKYMPRISTIIKKDYLNSFWQGLLFFIVVPVLAFIGVLIVIGLPISFILMLSYTMVLIISGVVASSVIGGYFIKSDKKNNKPKQFAGLAIGAAIFVLLVMVPFVGWFLKTIFITMALGGMWKDTVAMAKAGKY